MRKALFFCGLVIAVLGFSGCGTVPKESQKKGPQSVCSPSAVANGYVNPWPACQIVCYVGYKLVPGGGPTCVKDTR